MKGAENYFFHHTYEIAKLLYFILSFQYTSLTPFLLLLFALSPIQSSLFCFYFEEKCLFSTISLSIRSPMYKCAREETFIIAIITTYILEIIFCGKLGVIR